MGATLKGRDLISAADLSRDDVLALFRRAAELKAEFRADRVHADPPLRGRTLAMLFQKPSLRTRVTFEAGMTQLGGAAINLTEDVVMGARETVRDVAKNLERFVDAIMARTGPHQVVVELATQASVPVINGLTLREHPCQALADLFTLHERFGELRGLPLAFVGDGNNVYHSLALLGATMGMEIRLAHPDGYEPNDRIVTQARGLAAAGGGRLVFAREPEEVVPGAAVIYTDAWTSMGQEAEAEERRDAFARYQVNQAMLDAAGGGRLVFAREPEEVVPGAAVIYTDAWTSMGQEAEAEERRDAFARYQVNQAMLDAAGDAVVMHCLPAHRGEEITSDVMDGPRSIIFDQSENRLHAQKALLTGLLVG